MDIATRKYLGENKMTFGQFWLNQRYMLFESKKQYKNVKRTTS